MGLDELTKLANKVEQMEKQIQELQKKDAVQEVVINQIKDDLVSIKLDISKGFANLSSEIKDLNDVPKNNVEKFKNAIINSIGSAIGAAILYLLINGLLNK